MDIYLIYKTDNWHSYASRDLIAIANTHNKAIALCKKQAKKEGNKISQDELFNLNNISQTQGYEGEGEFVIETVEKNVLL
jgi:plasmid replication initiation protein